MKIFMLFALLIGASANAQKTAKKAGEEVSLKLYLYEIVIKKGYYNELSPSFNTEKIKNFMKDHMLQAKHLKQNCVHIGQREVTRRGEYYADGVYTLLTNEPLTAAQVKLLEKTMSAQGVDHIEIKKSEVPTRELTFEATSFDGKLVSTRMKDPSKGVPTLSNSCETGQVKDFASDAFSFNGAREFLRDQEVPVTGFNTLKIRDKYGKIFAEGGLNPAKDLTAPTGDSPARFPSGGSGRRAR